MIHRLALISREQALARQGTNPNPSIGAISFSGYHTHNPYGGMRVGGATVGGRRAPRKQRAPRVPAGFTLVPSHMVHGYHVGAHESHSRSGRLEHVRPHNVHGYRMPAHATPSHHRRRGGSMVGGELIHPMEMMGGWPMQRLTKRRHVPSAWNQYVKAHYANVYHRLASSGQYSPKQLARETLLHLGQGYRNQSQFSAEDVYGSGRRQHKPRAPKRRAAPRRRGGAMDMLAY